MSNMIKLIYSLNNEDSSVAFDSNNKIASLKTLINLTQKINLDEYEVFYKKREINWTDETPIRTIIGKENVPIFFIKLKSNKSNEVKGEKKIDNNKVDSKSPNDDIRKSKDHDKKEENQNETVNLKCKVMIENLPSRPEFFQLLEKFEEKKQAKHQISHLNTVSGIQITFKNPDLAYDFIKYINLEKVNNPLYSKLTTTLVVDAKKQVKVKNDKGDKILKTDNKTENTLEVSQISRLMNNEQNSRFFKLNNHLSKSQKYKELAIFEKFNKINDEKIKHNILKKHYKNANFLSLASPYISEEERYRKEYLDNKKKWIDKKGFSNALPKNSAISEIPNYVNLDHYGETAINHQFRDDPKEKYIDKNRKNFIV